MGRPPTRSTALVAVSIDGKGAAWCDGVYAGDRDITTYAQLAAQTAMPVSVGFDTFIAGDTDALGALISLIAYSPGRAFITEAPEDVLGAIEASREGDAAATWAAA